MDYYAELDRLIEEKGKNLKEEDKEKYEMIVNASKVKDWLTSIPYNVALPILSFLGFSDEERVTFYAKVVKEKLNNSNSVFISFDEKKL